MRPKQLEITGFTTFRQTTTIDFDNTDLFVLVGPTGSGKSSLIDAMIFALYGSVPRYQDAKLVAPILSQGRNEARVRLVFSVGGKDYTAVRVVRRTPAGATTKEARLECDGEVLASGPKELTDQVERILGLTFAQFTTCVVLPQGDFAKFLNDKPADRGDLLIKLLGLGLYERIRSAAASRAAEAKSRIAVHDEELGTLTNITKESEKEAMAGFKAIELAQKNFQKDSKHVTALETAMGHAAEKARQLASDIKKLEHLETPRDVKVLAAERAKREQALKEAKAAAKKVRETVVSDEQARAALGESAPLIEARQRYVDLDAARKTEEAAKKVLASRAAVIPSAEKSESVARERLNAAQSAREIAQHEHRAHALQETLAVGGPCPVCGRAIHKIPNFVSPHDLIEAEAAIKRAEAALVREAKTLQETRTTLSLAEGEAAAATKRVAGLQKQLKSAQPIDAIVKSLAAIDQAENKLKASRKAENAAIDAMSGARDQMEALAEREADAWKVFGETRDDLAQLKPPAAEANDLPGAWGRLLDWGSQQIPALTKTLDVVKAEMEKIDKDKDDLINKHVVLVTELGYEIDDAATLADDIAQFVADARSAHSLVKEKLERKAELETLVGAAKQRAQTADALALHLRSDRFERWLLEAAFERLVLGASEVLRGLSSGAYSFAYNKKLEFEVIDHANANETRSARTLSGGETFLASLALALTLADQLADLAAQGAAKLESMFLDEGFGSLDTDTLDTVASAIEELGSRGRMVGLVTHVADLAERVPVQYRVTKGPATSTVERVAS